METIWEKTKTALKKIVPDHCYRMWIEPLEYAKTEKNRFILDCPNYFSKKRVDDQYLNLIEKQINTISDTSWKIVVEIKEKKEIIRSSISEKPHREQQLILPSMESHHFGGRVLRKDFTFDSFVVGGSNNFAYSASMSLASQSDIVRNGLLLLSNTGMGKSHLSQAVGHHILQQYADKIVYYITAEDFTNEMVYAFRTDTLQAFKERYRTKCDVLLMEDVHFLTGKERTQIELASALDYLLDANKKIIFTSCCLPTDIPKMNDQLKSRLSASVISRIEPPDFSMRLKILQTKSRKKELIVPGAVLEFLAGELSENVRQLESGLAGVAAKSSLLGRPITMELAQSVIKNISKNKKEVTIESIKKMVCYHYGVSPEQIVSRSRKQAIVRPRQMAIYLCRKYTAHTLDAIGKSFNRYHATALHSIATIEKEMKHKGAVQKQVEYLSRKLETGNF